MESNEGSNIDVLNERLDELSISIVRTIHKILIERQYLDGTLKEGYIFLAKSRYLMRGQKVNMMQTSTSTPKASLKSFSFSDISLNTEYVSFSVKKDLKTSISTESSLKKRPTGKEDDLCDAMKNTTLSSETIHTDDGKDNAKKDDSPEIEDPIKWFGVLVPNTLRISQDHFAQAGHTAVKIASLQNELKALCGAYRQLRLKKNQLSEE